MDPTSSLAVDGRSLDRLKLEASRDPQSAARKVATQFEALFMQSLLKGLRDTIPRSGLMEGPQSELYTSMLDQQLAQKMAGRPGGLADVIARQLARNFTPGTPSSGTPSAGLPSAAGMGASGAPGASGTPPAMGAAAPGGAATADPRVLRAIDLMRARQGGISNQVRAAAAAAANAGANAAAGAMGAMGADGGRIDAATSQQALFVRRMWQHALAAQRETGTPAHLVVGQAALESGWGKHEITRADGSTTHNLFGIKAGRDWKGKTVEVATTEYIGGRPQRMIQRFRAYDSYGEAFKDWSRLMSGNTRYQGVMRASHDVSAYAHGMQKAGYATDPAYGSKLEKTIHRTLALRRLVI